MVDARQFFQARQPLWSWDYLQSLALTSPLLTHGADRGKVSDLLMDAGEAALHMPKLHTMTLWNGGRGEACAFTYRRQGGKCPITWRGTWDLKPESCVVQAWERVASKYSVYSVWVESQLLRRGTISSHGDAIHQLDLPSGVVDPVSLWQIRREESLRWRRTVPGQ